MKVVVVSQARMTSTRLPGKVLKKVKGKALLEYHIERLQQVKNADEIIVATTVETTDDPIVQLCKDLDVGYVRGSEHDVLARYYQAAKSSGADVVVRVTSDCPLIAPTVVDEAISLFHTQRCDYASNTLVRSYPRGMDVEVFSVEALNTAYQQAHLDAQREHVTPYIYQNPEKFMLINMVMSPDLSKYRWTVDTEEDFRLVKNILEALPIGQLDFSLQDIVKILELHSDWNEINAHVEQKKIDQ